MAKLTRKQHLAMAECLREAKLVLSTTRFQGLCMAVADSNFDYKVQDLVLEWIEEQLGDFAYVTWWLQEATGEILRGAAAQQYRHAWVDHMIKVLES